MRYLLLFFCLVCNTAFAAFDGWSVGGQCVVDKTDSEGGLVVGQASLEIFEQTAPYIIENLTGPNTGTFMRQQRASWLSTPIVGFPTYMFLPYYNFQTGSLADLYFMAAPCDSSIQPTSALDVLTPDIPTAIKLVLSIWLVWTVGFGIRSLIRTLHSSDDSGSDNAA